ncbi:MAG: hypothetical protein ACI4JF_08200 [Oscillospiraceae bacterium]
MYKKIIAAILCAAAMVGFAPAVSADVIWEPSSEDKFFYEHQSEISYGEWREYKTNKDTKVYEDPNGKTVKNIYLGEKTGVQYKYTDKNGVLWGGFPDDENYNNMLWIKLDGLEVVYDNISFIEEHSDEIYPYDNSFSCLDSDDPITFYDYPYSENYFTSENHPQDWTSYIHSLYKDETTVWGYISYMWGEKGWVMLENMSVTVTEATEQSTTAASKLTSDTEAAVTTAIRSVDKPVKSGSSLALAGILAAAAAGVSAVLLIIFGKKKK